MKTRAVGIESAVKKEGTSALIERSALQFLASDVSVKINAIHTKSVSYEWTLIPRYFRQNVAEHLCASEICTARGTKINF